MHGQINIKIRLQIWSTCPLSQISSLVWGCAFSRCVWTHCKSLYHHHAYHHNSPKYGTLQWHSSCAEDLLLLRESNMEFQDCTRPTISQDGPEAQGYNFRYITSLIAETECLMPLDATIWQNLTSSHVRSRLYFCLPSYYPANVFQYSKCLLY
jgi:hypothetical protein